MRFYCLMKGRRLLVRQCQASSNAGRDSTMLTTMCNENSKVAGLLKALGELHSVKSADDADNGLPRFHLNELG